MGRGVAALTICVPKASDFGRYSRWPVAGIDGAALAALRLLWKNPGACPRARHRSGDRAPAVTRPRTQKGRNASSGLPQTRVRPIASTFAVAERGPPFRHGGFLRKERD